LEDYAVIARTIGKPAQIGVVCLAELLPLPYDMKPVLRLVKGRRNDKKAPALREQRFRYPAEEVWEVSCAPTRERPARKDRRAS
jgi:hypothetical protein